MSRRAHIAMISIPAHGHVNPSLEIVKELIARGHRVTYANDPSFAEHIVGTGAELVPYRSTLPKPGVPGQQWPEDPIAQFDVFLDDSIAMLPQLRAAYDADRPDLFLYDVAGYAARILAENWDRPAVQLSPTFVAWEGFEQDMSAMVQALRSNPRAPEHYRRFSKWLTENGASETNSDLFVGRPPRSLVLIPRALQPNSEKVDPGRFTIVGPCFGERAQQGVWKRPASAGKVLLVSLGSSFTDQPQFYRRCLEAFGDLPGWHVVLQIGAHIDPAVLGTPPRNVEIHSWVPQLSVLEQADAFVTHAGMGSTQEGLSCGVPMIAVPQAVDQFSNADRLVALGVGRRIETAQATPEVLREALRQLTSDPEVASRLAVIQRELREDGGTLRAADLIESELQ